MSTEVLPQIVYNKNSQFKPMSLDELENLMREFGIVTMVPSMKQITLSYTQYKSPQRRAVRN
jgi:hypothetical protein